MVVVSEWERDKRRGEEENGVLLVVWVSPEVATVMVDGRATKEGEQTKALAMPLMEGGEDDYFLRNFRQNSPSNAPRGGENTSYDRSAFKRVENREI
ncbi:hypothetical protein MTR67_017329 [Solanum verrucosum]|uniref:Uncharacterized protein n=1 Tax=Solanum verrucosum TaxID=315347 RepID=A0AAF0QQ29_SOLVR|nr:hypothetical protein MTR67_017329 [Solanum verrucosum]